MRLLFRLILSFSLALAPPVHAQSRDQKTLEEAIKTAGSVATEQLVKGYLDKAFPTGTQAAAGTASAGAGAEAKAGTEAAGKNSGVTVGGAFLFAVSLGLSIDEFAKATTDKGKGYAVANAVVAGITLVFPVAGLIAGGVVLVVRLVDGAVSAQHAKQMMETYTRINNLYQEAVKMQTNIVNSEKAKFVYAFQQLDAASRNVQAGQKYLQENCTAAEAIDSLEKVDGCLKSTIQLIEEFQRLVDYSESLLAPTTRILKTDVVFENLKIDPQTFQQALTDNRARLKQMRDGLNDTLKGYGDFMTDVVIKNAQQVTMKDLPRIFKSECLSKARRLNLQAAILLSPERYSGINAMPGERVSDLHQLRDLMEQFQYSGCSSVSVDPTLDQLYDEMNTMLLENYKVILKEGA